MKVIYIDNFNKKYIDEPICACIGNFDGLHIGHQALIDEVKKTSYAHAMITFNPHPIKVFLDDKYKELTPLETKIELLKDKLDYLIVLNFNEDLYEKSAEEFINILKQNFVKEIVCGEDFHFGYKASGTTKMLQDNFIATIVPTVSKDGIEAKSQIIRLKLSTGDIKEANNLLGRPYEIKGLVEHGAHVGRKIGFPTANFNDVDYLLPKNGVYYTITKINGKEYKSMTNIGHNPTFNLKEKVTVETNILDFDDDIYGQTISIRFIELIRDEKKFASIDDLKKELKINQDFVKNTCNR